MMRDVRLFVEKKPGYRLEASHLQDTINNVLGIPIKSCRVVLIYDVFHCDENTLSQAIQSVFQEQVIDELFYELDTTGYTVIAYETLDGQYDQRADAAMQCIQLLNPESKAIVKCGVCVLIDKVSDSDRNVIADYLINPVETKTKDLKRFGLSEAISIKPMASFNGFIKLDSNELKQFYNEQSLAMTLDDLRFVQETFLSLNRDPSETELRVLDTYWSDHCRHTTFNTKLEKIDFDDFDLKSKIEASLNAYLKDRRTLNRDNKPVTLMDVATINARLAKHKGDTVIEESEEVNACSIRIDVNHNGVLEPWLLMFKNETHNHPTEIEPFGGASTCIGGAIRDPLSGRSYVYQAMRISGCGDVSQSIRDTLPHKLPQSLIAKRATDGYSSYGNQIGLTTTYVHEIYHPSYVAKHLECGAVVGAVKETDVMRGSPQPGDVVILVGGRTGRDGIGGATGSSVAHKETSLTQSAAEVQKGNAPEERKIQRLFRNPDVSKMIKRCNDFGAGGVAVAIGELADGLDIALDKVRLKYKGLNPTEIAISESQERMAVVVRVEDRAAFIEAAHNENLEAYDVACVTDTNQLVMRYQDEVIVQLDRDFLNSSGAPLSCAVLISDKGKENPFGPLCSLERESLLELASSITFGSQKGLIERFDGSIGSTTVLMPLAGKTQRTINSASVQKIPVLDGKTDTCSMLSYGFIPEISDYAPYLGGQYAIVESVAKTVAQGGDWTKIYLSLQEYFARPTDSKKWGNVLQALLGAYEAQKGLGLAAIGGKDSMSGTYQDIDVVDTLISFACSPQNVETIQSSALKHTDSKLYLVGPARNKDNTIDFEKQAQAFSQVHQAIKDGTVLSASTIDRGNVFLSVLNMALGNSIGVVLKGENLLSRLTGGIVVECSSDVVPNDWVSIGYTTNLSTFVIGDIEFELETLAHAHLNALSAIYPNRVQDEPSDTLWLPNETPWHGDAPKTNTVHVVIPVFPGNNCEYDMARAFEDAGATTEIVVFKNLTPEDVNSSIQTLKEAIKHSHILAIPGGFSSGDEPDGSAKFIVNVLKNPEIKQVITEHLAQKRLILGICNGFQALIKSGLIPYGTIRDVDDTGITLFRNDCQHHVSTLVNTVVATKKSPWLKSMEIGQVHTLPVSHGEGKLVGNLDLIKQCHENGLVAFQYCDERGKVTVDAAFNPNGSMLSIEGMISEDGLVLGKMAHSERIGCNTFIDINPVMQSIFRDGVNYFKEGL